MDCVLVKFEGELRSREKIIMILLDFSQTMIGSFMAMGKGSVVVEEDLLRHTVLNTILNYKKTHRHIYDGTSGPGLVFAVIHTRIGEKSLFPNTRQIGRLGGKMILLIGRVFSNF